nr:unnamed protein product [Callosobruchus chinensis]
MKIDIPTPRRIKTSARNKFQPFLILPFLNSYSENCVASTLLSYLEKTKLLRGSIKSLFISITKPYKEISTQSLGRWVKNILEKSGVDTNKFSAHSTRHASTSAANRKGINFDTIRLSAGWSKNSKMFAKVYNRPLVSDISFAEARIIGTMTLTPNTKIPNIGKNPTHRRIPFKNSTGEKSCQQSQGRNLTIHCDLESDSHRFISELEPWNQMEAFRPEQLIKTEVDKPIINNLTVSVMMRI